MRISLYRRLKRAAGRILRAFPAAVALSLWLFGAVPASADEPLWLLIDTGNMSLSVMQGNVVRRTYTNISIGRSGVTEAKQHRDGKTPLGEFRIVRTLPDTPFHRFFTLDYPNLRHAEHGHRAGIISDTEYSAITTALRAGKLPPQHTALGGYIGIHGIGRGNLSVHNDFNWTFGCIALTNAQIDELSQRVHIGMKVVIRR